MGNSDDESVAFRTNALDVVGSWLLGDSEDSSQASQQQHRPVILYRPSSVSSGKSMSSLTRPKAVSTAANLTEQERKMKSKILRNPCARREEDAVRSEKEAQVQLEDAQDEEEQELLRSRNLSSKLDMKRKRTTQEELLDTLREEALLYVVETKRGGDQKVRPQARRAIGKIQI
ncbi:uncharacterized protein PHALS_10051 [Plasmopara halstedii]|uniref:Uncharacterized protein n=1 Tax=Plasmopara halstedii TaxID=4781 RepID=A0A0P1AG22_PLAHL|nr:uncharacterized protein PHALS_10051 [Plasmopara halstedii]CEG39817.1 hypothetical protein PHALS_10051 [Plasmopara halstedii]|eukprot:XP_024576186.1 hypothetical protein PHALS_10051 [Plasmopara halstedii]